MRMRWTRCRWRADAVGLCDEAQPARVRQHRVVAAEAVVRVERDDRAVHGAHRMMQVDDARFARFDAACRMCRRPCTPRRDARIAGLEQEATAVGEHAPRAAQRRIDFRVGQQALERMPGHHDRIERRRVGRQAVEPARKPVDRVGARLASGVFDHRRRGIDRRDVVPGCREPARERAGAAAEVEDASTCGADHGRVEREIPIARVEQVVDRDEARVGVERFAGGRGGGRHAAARVSAAARPRAARAR